MDPSLRSTKKTEVDVEEAYLNGAKHCLQKRKIHVVCDTYN